MAKTTYSAVDRNIVSEFMKENDRLTCQAMCKKVTGKFTQPVMVDHDLEVPRQKQF